MSCVDDQTEVKGGEVQDNVLEASACYSGVSWIMNVVFLTIKFVLNVDMNYP